MADKMARQVRPCLRSEIRRGKRPRGRGRLRYNVEETGEGVGEISEVVAFDQAARDSHGTGIDAERAEKAAEGSGGETSVDCQVSGVEGEKLCEKLFGRETSDTGLGEDLADRGEQMQAEGIRGGR